MKTFRQYSNALGKKLSEEQTRTVIEWLAQHTHTEVAAMISAPPPEGLGIQTSPSAVGRFAILHAEEIGEYKFESLDSYLTGITGVSQRDDDFHDALDQGNYRLLQEKVFYQLVKTDPTPQQLRALASVTKIVSDRLREEQREKDAFLQRLALYKAAKTGQKIDAQAQNAA